MNNSTVRPVGFASGAFRPLGITIEEAMTLNNACGANAFEITFGTIDEMYAFEPTCAIKKMRDSLLHFSVHLPFKGITGYTKTECDLIADTFAPIAHALKPNAAVVHVELINDWAALAELQSLCSVPIAVENADCRKGIADDVPVLLEAAKQGFALVFDIAHARSRTAELGEDPLRWPSLLKKGNPLARSLSHIHASINTPGGSHVRFAGHPEKDAVIHALEKGALKGKPVILEGPLDSVTAKSLSLELAGFITDYI